MWPIRFRGTDNSSSASRLTAPHEAETQQAALGRAGQANPVLASLARQAEPAPARSRLTAGILEIAHERESSTVSLQRVRADLDEVLVADARFPFHLAAYANERLGRRRLAVALLVEAANRAHQLRQRPLPFALAPIVSRVVRNASDAAFAMAYQVNHFGWSMPGVLRVALSRVLDRKADHEEAPEEAFQPQAQRPLGLRPPTTGWRLGTALAN